MSRATIVGSITVSPECTRFRGHEDGDIPETVREQVAGVFGVLLQEPGGITRVDML